MNSRDSRFKQRLLKRLGCLEIPQSDSSRGHKLERPGTGQTIVGFAYKRKLRGSAIKITAAKIGCVVLFERDAKLPGFEDGAELVTD